MVVSIPHRYGKNSGGQVRINKASGVSIPHRYGKNVCSRNGFSVKLVWVSIPHRYGKNASSAGKAPTWYGMFPFLIGTVRTVFCFLNVRSCFQFPFLIGTVRTVPCRNCTLRITVVSIPHRYGKNQSLEAWNTKRRRVSIPHRYGKNDIVRGTTTKEPMFPFLIGTVRTFGYDEGRYDGTWVSIPHRYGKNSDRGFRKGRRSYQVSIPHRYGKNSIGTLTMRTWSKVSIPHRYGKNQVRTDYDGQCDCVSIPHRYGKNAVRSSITKSVGFVSIPHRYGKNGATSTRPKGWYWVFPFLIGTVRTYNSLKDLDDEALFPFLIGTVRT